MAERVRLSRTEQQFDPEEDSDSESEQGPTEVESEAEMTANFLRVIKERFIYGLLDHIDYDKIDWDEALDVYYNIDSEEKWFDEEEDG